MPRLIAGCTALWVAAVAFGQPGGGGDAREDAAEIVAGEGAAIAGAAAQRDGLDAFRYGVARVEAFDGAGERIWFGLGTFVAPDRVVLPWIEVESAARITVQPLCCEKADAAAVVAGGVESGLLVVSVAFEALPEEFAIVPLARAESTAAMTTADTVWTGSVPIGITGDQGETAGFLMGRLKSEALVANREYAGVGRLLRVRYDTDIVMEGSPILDEAQRVVGILADWGGAKTSLAIPADRLATIERFEPITVAAYGARELTDRERSMRQMERAADLRDERPRDAIPLLRKAIKADEENWRAHFLLGVCLDQTGRGEEAIGALARSREIESGFAEAWYSGGVVRLGREEGAEAVPLLERAVELDPWYVNANGMLAVAYLQAGRQGDAIEAGSRAIAISTEPNEHFDNLMLIYKMAGREGEGEHVLERLCEVAPEDAEAWIRLGSFRIGLDKFEEAMVALERAVELEADNVNAWLYGAVALGMMERFDEAIEWADEVLRLQPENGMAKRMKELAREGIEKRNGGG